MSGRPPNIKPQRSRQNMPSGYFIGRTDPGKGPEQLIPLQAAARALGATGMVGGTKLTHALISFKAEGLFAANQHFEMDMAPIDATFPSTDPMDFANANFPAVADTDFFLTNNLANFLFDGSNLMCTVTFPAGGGDPVFVWNGSTTVNQGDILHVVCDGTPDPGLAEVQILFSGDIVP